MYITLLQYIYLLTTCTFTLCGSLVKNDIKYQLLMFTNENIKI